MEGTKPRLDRFGSELMARGLKLERCRMTLIPGYSTGVVVVGDVPRSDRDLVSLWRVLDGSRRCA